MTNVLEDCIVLVTGAGQGIGRALASAIAEEGATVIVADINEETATRTAGEIREKGYNAAYAVLDVSSESSCLSVAARLISDYGRLDGLVNDAAIFSTLRVAPFWDITLEEWEQVIRVNLTGVWLTTKTLLPLLRQSSRASVVNFASGTVWNGLANYAHYVASKAGVVGLTRTMGNELGDAGIRVNAVTPGLISTEVPRTTMTSQAMERAVQSQALKKLATPTDIAGPVIFLLSSASGFMTGQSVNVDGGVNFR
jgi:3-oxoacyl-[acyl-carrier protein] reductase